MINKRLFLTKVIEKLSQAVIVKDFKDKINISVSLKKAVMKDLNKLLMPLNKTEYFSQIPMKELFRILNSHNLEAIDEDGTLWSGFLTGETGKASIQLAFKDKLRQLKKDMRIPQDNTHVYRYVNNSDLILTWHKMESSRYEVVAYLS